MEVKRFGLGLDKQRQVAGGQAAVEAAAAVHGKASDDAPRTRRGRLADRVADRRGDADPQAQRAEPGPALLHPLRLQDGLDARAHPRAHADRSVVPRSDPAARASSRTSSASTSGWRTCRRTCSSGPSSWGTPIRSWRISTSATSRRRRSSQVRRHRKRLGIEPVYKLVDTCAAEFEAVTPYYYSTYEPPVASRERRGGACGGPCTATTRSA